MHDALVSGQRIDTPARPPVNYLTSPLDHPPPHNSPSGMEKAAQAANRRPPLPYQPLTLLRRLPRPHSKSWVAKQGRRGLERFNTGEDDAPTIGIPFSLMTASPLHYLTNGWTTPGLVPNARMCGASMVAPLCVAAVDDRG